MSPRTTATARTNTCSSLVEHYLDYDEWFRQKVTGSLEQLDRGEFLTHEEVGDRLKRLLQP